MQPQTNKKKLNSTTIFFTYKNLVLNGEMLTLNLNIQLNCQLIKNNNNKKNQNEKRSKKKVVCRRIKDMEFYHNLDLLCLGTSDMTT